MPKKLTDTEKQTILRIRMIQGDLHMSGEWTQGGMLLAPQWSIQHKAYIYVHLDADNIYDKRWLAHAASLEDEINKYRERTRNHLQIITCAPSAVARSIPTVRLLRDILELGKVQNWCLQQGIIEHCEIWVSQLEAHVTKLVQAGKASRMGDKDAARECMRLLVELPVQKSMPVEPEPTESELLEMQARAKDLVAGTL